MNDILINVDGVSKKFCKSLRKSLKYGLQDLGHELTGSRHGGNGNLRPDEFWAVNDVSFELRRGECLGLIGRNGAGKTTLLRMLNGLIKPDQGRIEMRGRMGAFIALGAGFNPILSGRENIYVNGSVLGLTKQEIDEKIDEIIDFAEIGDFIDSPVQSYSSGMQVRLGFAVASTLDPDILLLDEVLAVGDTAFRYKCYKRIDKLRKKSAVIFVSHDMPSISRICNRAILLKHGEVLFNGDTLEGVEMYNIQNEGDSENTPGRFELIYPVTKFCVNQKFETIMFNQNFPLNIDIESDEELENITLRINIANKGENHVASCAIDSKLYNIKLLRGLTRWNLNLSAIPLKAGKYYISAGITDEKGGIIAMSYIQNQVIVTGGHPGLVGDCQLDLTEWKNYENTNTL